MQPQRPDRRAIDAGALRELLEALPERVVVLLDEALRDFVDAEDRDAALALAERFPRLLVFRTFSKAWGLAGLRCGYAIGGPESEPLLEQLEPELGVNELAQAGALEALRHADVVARRVALVAEQRARIAAALPDRGLEAPPARPTSSGCAPRASTAAQLAERLQRGGVIVAPGAALGDPERVRVAVQGPQATDRLLRALELAREG